MIYGVPQRCRDPLTKRVKRLHLEAQSFSEEMLLTEIEKAFDHDNAVSLKLETKDGRVIMLDFLKKIEPADD